MPVNLPILTKLVCISLVGTFCLSKNKVLVYFKPLLFCMRCIIFALRALLSDFSTKAHLTTLAVVKFRSFQNIFIGKMKIACCLMCFQQILQPVGKVNKRKLFLCCICTVMPFVYTGCLTRNGQYFSVGSWESLFSKAIFFALKNKNSSIFSWKYICTFQKTKINCPKLIPCISLTNYETVCITWCTQKQQTIAFAGRRWSNITIKHPIKFKTIIL